MENFNLAATERTPAVDFDYENNTFKISGESYPEDVSAFYADFISGFEDYMQARNDCNITFEFELVYFNSSSAKVFMGLFDMLDEVASRNKVVINWLIEENDDNMGELGEEFGEDLTNATFNLAISSQE